MGRLYRMGKGLRAKPSNALLAGFLGANLSAAEKLKKYSEAVARERRRAAEMEVFEHQVALMTHELAEKNALKEMQELLVESIHHLNLPQGLERSFASHLAQHIGPYLMQLHVPRAQLPLIIRKIMASSRRLRIIGQMGREKKMFRKEHFEAAVEEIKEIIEQVAEQQQ